MTELTQHSVEQEIVRLSNMTERVTQEIGKRSRDWAELDSDYDVVFAKALLVADGKSEAIRKANALVACEDIYRKARIAEALLDSAREAGRNYRAQLDAYRSLNSNLRALVTG